MLVSMDPKLLRTAGISPNMLSSLNSQNVRMIDPRKAALMNAVGIAGNV